MTLQMWQALGLISAVISAVIVYWALSAFSDFDRQVSLMIAGIVAIIDFGVYQIFIKSKLQ